jgi:hypothetical protein
LAGATFTTSPVATRQPVASAGITTLATETFCSPPSVTRSGCE